MKRRVLRGGSYRVASAAYLRPSFRYWGWPENRYGIGGFRLVLQPLLKQQRRKT